MRIATSCLTLEVCELLAVVIAHDGSTPLVSRRSTAAQSGEATSASDHLVGAEDSRTTWIVICVLPQPRMLNDNGWFQWQLNVHQVDDETVTVLALLEKTVEDLAAASPLRMRSSRRRRRVNGLFGQAHMTADRPR